MALACVLMGARAAEPDDASNPLATIRARDDVRIHVRGAYLTFTETIVLTPAGVTAQRMRPGTMNSVNLLIAPFWFSDGSNQGPAFPVLRPQVTPSHGRVKRFALVRPDGEAVRSLSEVTPDCRYVLTLEFGHMPPERLTVTVQMSSPFGLRPGAELSYTPSNDGQPFRSGAPESFQTEVHVIADPELEPWSVIAGHEIVPRREVWVTLAREVRHTFRFGAPAP